MDNSTEQLPEGHSIGIHYYPLDGYEYTQVYKNEYILNADKAIDELGKGLSVVMHPEDKGYIISQWRLRKREKILDRRLVNIEVSIRALAALFGIPLFLCGIVIGIEIHALVGAMISAVSMIGFLYILVILLPSTPGD